MDDDEQVPAVRARRAEQRDLPYVDHVRRANSEALGFLPYAKYEALVSHAGPLGRPAERLWIATVDDEPVGFLYLTPGELGGNSKIIQVCVQEDARRREYATVLVEAAERYAQAIQRTGVSLSVAADLDASRFWEAVGYELRFLYAGGLRRGRVLERRYKRLKSGLWAVEAA